jgi:tetratricopeptide (TPR) repeat protein
MDAGSVVAERFEIERHAGAGGMGDVFLARDRATGARVALKVQSGPADPAGDARFEREAIALRSLSHPGIVRYVAHGLASNGRRWLAMEWLEGEDLAARLRRGPLGVQETIRLGRRVAEALGAAHARGVVHRDLKPSNLILVGGDVDQVKIIDLGIARLDWMTRATRTGIALGTPAYMAPEQAQGIQELDARADVFSLGAILYECVTGEPAFSGENVRAILVKILFDEAPRLGARCPDAPASLDRLLARMLAKSPFDRPEDGLAIAAALARVADESGEIPRAAGDPSEAARPAPGLGEAERRILCVLMIAAPPAIVATDAATVAVDDLHPSREMKDIVAARGGQLRVLADGSAAITLAGVGAATDQAARAAECALALRELLPSRAVALATGRGSVAKRVPAGEVIDRATALLLARERASVAFSQPPFEPLPIDIDAATAGLLDLRFDVVATPLGFALRGQREIGGGARTLLGRPTAFVGRDREIALLEAIFTESASEPGARAALVIAPAGAGKSRLLHELGSRLAARVSGVEVWIARGDPARSGVPFGMVAQLVKRTARLLDGEPLEVKTQKIAARAARHFDTTESRRVAEFLGEMVGAPFPDDASVQLRAARRDPGVMSDQVRRAFIDFVDAETRRRPLAIVLEDLHWGDRPSVDFLDAALKALAERPLFVLALARPEIHDLFPRLFAERALTEIRLGPLSRKACEKLARGVLGDAPAPEVLARLVARSEGNAFFLEELVRALAEGRGGELPDTVLAMLEARLEALDPEDRRVLRAASVFGEVFWESGVRALLGERAGEAAARLARLQEREWIGARADAKFQGEREYGFRHALVREAVYGMLTAEDRALGHRLAGEWLEAIGESDAVVIAEHLERGGEPQRAVRWYRRAAEQALEGGEPLGALRRVERAIACGAEGEALGALLVIRADAHGWRAEHAEAEGAAKDALAVLPVGSGRWYAAIRVMVSAACPRGDTECLMEAARVLLDHAKDPGPIEQVTTMASVAGWLFLTGFRAEAEELHDAAIALAPRFEADPAVMGTIDFYMRALRASVEGDVYQGYRLMASAAARFEQAGDQRRQCKAEASAAMMLCDLGGYAEAAALLERTLPVAERLNTPSSLVMTRATYAFALAHTGSFEEARALAELATAAPSGDRRADGEAWIYRTIVLDRAGDREGAEAAARRAREIAVSVANRRSYAAALAAKLLLARGDAAGALVIAREAEAEIGTLARGDMGQAEVRLVLAESLFATGDREAARRAIASARDALLVEAAKIPDLRWRERFLAEVPANARTMALAADWLAPDPSVNDR